MNSRERTLKALNHQQPARVPVQLWLTPEVSSRLQTDFELSSEDDLWNELDIDVRWLLVDYVGPELKTFSDDSQENEFSIYTKTRTNEYGCYDEFVSHPLTRARTLQDIENYRWPDPDWWDYSSIEREIVQADRVQPRWVGIGYASIFERAWNIIGFEKLLYDIAANPELAEALFDRLLDFYLEQTSRILQAANGRVDMIYIADDLGSQQGLLFSPDMYRRFLKGRWQTFIQTLKDRFGNHLKCHFHSYGAVFKLIPDLIKTGIDLLNPIQPKTTGMEPENLKDNFGNRLSFCCGLDIQANIALMSIWSTSGYDNYIT